MGPAPGVDGGARGGADLRRHCLLRERVSRPAHPGALRRVLNGGSDERIDLDALCQATLSPPDWVDAAAGESVGDFEGDFGSAWVRWASGVPKMGKKKKKKCGMWVQDGQVSTISTKKSEQQ